MFQLAQLFSAATAVLCLGFIFWVVYVRREFFNPMLYIIYGVFHWMVVGQLGTMFLGAQHYEPRSDFPDEVYLVATTIIFLSVVASLMGFYAFSSRRLNLVPWKFSPRMDSLALLTIFIGGISGFILIRHILTFTIDQASFEYSLIVLPLTLPLIAASVLGSFIYFRANRSPRIIGRWIPILCGLLPIFVLITSNVMVVFALYGMVFWYLNRKGKVLFVSRKFLILLAVLIPFAMLSTLVVKIIQRPDDLETVFSIAKLFAAETIEEALYRFGSLDIFNVEGFSLFLVVIDRIGGFEDLKFGATYVAALFPFMKFIFPEIRGMGRQLAIDEGYGDGNVSFATPPMIELFANFGLLSPLIGYFVIGVLMARLYRWHLASPRESHGLIYSFVMPWLFFMQRGDAINTLLYPAYIFVVMLIILRMSNVRMFKNAHVWR